MSFILTLIVIIYMIIVTIADIICVLHNPVQIIPCHIEAITLIIVLFISFILGITARSEKESKKTLPNIAIIISGLLLIPAIVGLIEGIFLRLSM
ncbi:hypothetical protein FDC50_14500 [Clostridium botulinum]|nr:hypothetical protein KU41_12500 [Clostridium botulinum]MBY6802502.1 hypothetical protein [Clostridium botulinum]MBY6812639.1 hypothetical protein [Clostridium botulinum]MBY6819253.1 hypothetical protein [Clostridium botulinum]NFJ50668.1 hypothetical protein [Clostridium botulinum]